MTLKHRLTAIAAGSALAAGATVAASAPASADGHELGTEPLAPLLLADESGFDDDDKDFDILKAAVLAVLENNPDSAVGVLTDGEVALTAFLPRDRAFYNAAREATGDLPSSEQEAFEVIASLGLDTVENVLLYHVVPGATIDRDTAKAADGAVLETALGATIEVDIKTNSRGFGYITIIDNDPDARTPVVVKTNINEGNRQIAHAVNAVILPVDL